MSRYRRCLPALTSDTSFADSDDTPAMDQDARMQRDFNNDLLSQAISYLAAEGDDDPGAVYIDRVRFIDVRLLQQLPAQGSHYDTKLYRRVRSKVRAVLREYEDAVDTSPDLIGEDDDVPELQLSSPVEALFRADDEEGTPLRTPGQPRIETRRHFRYGGPGSEVEIWHKDLPNSLPFPETIRMQDWESMRINFDLACAADQTITEPVLKNIPYEHPDLEHHNSLGQYESGSRFKLPEVDAGTLGMISKVGTVDNLRKAVSFFNQGGVEQTEEYAPRVFLEKLRVHPGTVIGHTPSPTSIRRAMDNTPTRARPGGSDVRVGTISKGMRNLLGQGPASANSSGSNVNSPPTSKSPSTSALDTSSPSKPENPSALNTSSPPKRGSNSSRASPAARRISRVVHAAIAGSSKSTTAETTHPKPRSSSARPPSPASKHPATCSRTTSPTPTRRTKTPSTTSPSTKRKHAAPQPKQLSKHTSTSSSSSSPSPPHTQPPTMPGSSKASGKRKRAAPADPTYKPGDNSDSQNSSPSSSPTTSKAMSLPPIPAATSQLSIPQSKSLPTKSKATSMPSTKSPAKRKRAVSSDPSYRPEKKRARGDGASSSGDDDDALLDGQ